MANNKKESTSALARNAFVKNYKRMWPYVKPYWFQALLSVLLAMPIGALEGVIAMSLKPYMDLVVITGGLVYSIGNRFVHITAGCIDICCKLFEYVGWGKNYKSVKTGFV